MSNVEKQATAATDAKSNKGQRKRTEILEAARAVLMEEGHAAFTTRRVAERLEMNLGHLYYYFPTKIGLVRALAEQIEAESTQRYDAIFHSSDEDPQAQFTNLIDFLLDDIYNPKILHFSLHIWVLLEQESDEKNNLLNEVYERDRTRLSKLLQPLNLQLPYEELTERTAILVAMIEGLTLMIGDNPETLPGIRKKVHSLARALIMDSNLFKQKAK